MKEILCRTLVLVAAIGINAGINADVSAQCQDCVGSEYYDGGGSEYIGGGSEYYDGGTEGYDAGGGGVCSGCGGRCLRGKLCGLCARKGETLIDPGPTDNVDPTTGIGNSVDQSKWPCQGNCQFTNGNWDVACPGCQLRQYQMGVKRAWQASRDRFHPAPGYAYSHNGIDAARTDAWNRSRAQQTPWHGGHNYWRWNAPTALVVPPTASFQTNYSWGVGGTTSLPINHQFGSANPGGGSGISQQFSSAPHWPSNTNQLGVYPVRAPWSHIR